jgi:hypothetical protein
MAALIPVARASDLEAEAKKRSDELQNKPVIQGLAAHVRTRWDSARTAKRDLEDRMLQCLRQRNGEYDPDKAQDIAEQGGSDIYINLTSVKCRAATSWLRDTLLGSGADKPWSIEGTPNPDMPPEILQGLQAELAQQLGLATAAGTDQQDQLAVEVADFADESFEFCEHFHRPNPHSHQHSRTIAHESTDQYPP